MRQGKQTVKPTKNEYVASPTLRVPFPISLFRLRLNLNSRFLATSPVITLSREVKLDVYGKRQTVNGKRQTANGKRQTANGKRQTANGKRQTANGKRQTANGKRQTANGKNELLLCLFSCVHSGVKLFVFAIKSRRLYSIFVWFIYGLAEKNSKAEVMSSAVNVMLYLLKDYNFCF